MFEPAKSDPKVPPAKSLMPGAAAKLNIAVPTRMYTFESQSREVKGQLRITGLFGGDELERLSIFAVSDNRLLYVRAVAALRSVDSGSI
jgi:hypothetical protein